MDILSMDYHDLSAVNTRLLKYFSTSGCMKANELSGVYSVQMNAMIKIAISNIDAGDLELVKIYKCWCQQPM